MDIVLGATHSYAPGGQPVVLLGADRARHLYVVGQTGTGKSTLLEHLIAQDIENGEGVALLDPHGSTAEALLDHIPRSRADDVIYFNPADLEHPVALNPLARVEADRRHLVAEGVVTSFKNAWADSWGVRLEDILRKAVYALLEQEGATLLSIARLLHDDDYRRRVSSRIKNPVVRRYWQDTYPGFTERYRAEAIAPVLNKVDAFLTNPVAQNILGQARGKLDVRHYVMDRKKIFIANLSKGQIGEETAKLLGALLVSQFQLAALSRADVPECERVPFHLYIDEFQNFTTEAFATILSEARKYRLTLTLAHQYLEQLSPELSAAVFGNVGTLVCFRVSRRDGERLAGELHPISVGAFGDLSNYATYVRLLWEGEPQMPRLMRALPPREAKHCRRARLIALSRERFGTRRQMVEHRLARSFACGG
jgi:hypothetical protein